MIVLFLGSWRSTLVVMISIPLSILSSLIALYFLGYTINTMTLGGLALAIGILVDDSTVTIENTHRLLTEERMPLPAATLHGAAGIAVPTLVSTLAISCVFVSVVFLHGPAKYLFTPLGLAVVFAMLASYGFSRTLTPITIGLLLKGERHGGQASRGWFARLFAGFERAFEAMRNAYTEVLPDAPHPRAAGRRGSARAGRHAVFLRWPRFLPDHRWRPDSAACARAGRHTHREDRADLPGD
jgi:multidrug efflux pump subunit AcrB